MQARQITLNLVPGGVMPRIHCSQYDKGVPVEVTIYDGDTTYTIPQDATVYVQGTKLDGTLYQYECTYSGSVVYFDLTIQMTVIAGENTAELSIYDSNEDIVGTCNFVIDVEDSALQDSSETSYNDIPVIADLPGLVKTAEEAAQTAVDAADGVELDMDEIREAVSKSSTSAQLASGYAVDSENYYLLSKSYAVGDTSRVGSSVDNAMYYMNLAKGYSEDTAEDVQTVEELMEDLEEIETRTKGYSDSAALSKTSVDTLYSQTVIAKTSADYFATLAESWAHGQTGIRQDESVDNAMYWANKAQAVAKTTVDSAFSTSSLNPVENRVITNQHVNVKINQVNGVHGLRYYNDLLEYYDTDTSQWVEIETGGGTLIVQPPVAASQTYTYDGTEQTFQFSSIDTANCTISNNKKTAAGTYTVTVSLKETNYVWADDLTNADRTFTWTINKAQVAIPVAASQSYTYDGTQQTFAFTTTIDTTLINVTGNEQTNAGSYTVSCALVDSNNYEWADSTTAAKTYSWTIAKAASSISVSPASITFDANNLTATLVPTTTGDGTVSYAIDKPSIATIAGNVVTATQTTGTATITATISETTNYASASTTISVTASFILLKIFAVHYSENNSDPNSCTYPEGYTNSGWTPFSMNLSTGVPNYGSWNPSGDNADLVKFIFPRSCMLKYDGTVDYYLNENDETKKEDGTASDVANTSYGGNAMMEWGQDGIIYWKILPDSDNKGWTFIVSNAQKDKDGKDDPDMRPWNHYDCNGNVAAHWYTAKYFGSNISSKIRSISGQSNYVNDNDANETTKCRANNTTSNVIWDKEVYADWMFIALMCVLLGKSLNTQAKFGYGRCNSSSAIGQGTMNGKGMFYGVSDQTSGVKVFGMENILGGNLWRRIRGLINVSGTVKVKMTHGTQDGTTVSDYNQTGSGYLTVGSIGGTSGGYISAMNITKYGLTPKTMSGSDSTYYTDGGWFMNNVTNVGRVGGGCDNALLVGAFSCALYGTASDTSPDIGAALSCKPLA